MKKHVTFTIDEDISQRLSIVSKKLKQSKSSIVEELIEQILPILEAKTPNKMMAEAMKQMAATIDTSATLFEDMAYDKSVEEYKEMKRG